MPPRSAMCPSCRRSLYAAIYQVGRHYGCRAPGPLDAESFDRLATYIADTLGTQTHAGSPGSAPTNDRGTPQDG